jgi:UDP-glucuronate 4-epimerase
MARGERNAVMGDFGTGMMSKKTILVTGAAGFIASHLIEKLHAEGHEVIGVDNFNDYYDINLKCSNLAKFFSISEVKKLTTNIVSPYRSFSNPVEVLYVNGFADDGPCINNFTEKPNYRLYGMDLCDYMSLRKVFQKHAITHVVHIAAVAGVRPSVENPILYQKNNGESTINLLKLAAEFKIQKFVFASSSSVYGSRSKVPFSESEDISKPISPYAATKVAGEAMVHSFSHLHKMPSVCLRFFTVYGPRQRPDLAISKFTKLIDAAKPIQIYGDGTAKRDFTYIEDIMDGILKAIDYECSFDIFNLGESHVTDVNELVRLLEERLAKKAIIEYGKPVPGDVPITYADITKSKALLGYNPQTQIAEGLTKYVEWYKNASGIARCASAQ